MYYIQLNAQRLFYVLLTVHLRIISKHVEAYNKFIIKQEFVH